jgi:hypothetical protein
VNSSTKKRAERKRFRSLQVAPDHRALLLVERPSGPRGAGYWDQERDLMAEPEEIELTFLDYFDFSQAPLKDFRYFLCRIHRFETRPEYEGRKALIEVLDAKVLHEE